MDIQNRSRIYNDSIRLIEISENPDVVFSRIQLAIENLTALLQYEEKGITTINPAPSDLLKVFKFESGNFFLDSIVKANNLLKVEILNLKSDISKRKHILKFINKIDGYISNVTDIKLLTEIRQYWEKQLQNLPLENQQVKRELIDAMSPLATSTEISINEAQPAKLLIVGKTLSNNVGFDEGIKISINMGIGSKIEFIGPEEPSIIYEDLPVRKPLDPNSIEPPSYYPTYVNLSPEQRWIYLNWLKDLKGDIDIGYVFLYYYGLERHLLIGNYVTSCSEIIQLRKYHNNKSFESYSYNALLFSSAYRGELQKALCILENESKNGIDKVDLLFKYRFEVGITPEELMSLARKIKGINLHYIKKVPDIYKAALSIILSEKYDMNDFQIHTFYRIQDLPMEQILAFANISFPSSLRLPILPNFLKYPPFIKDCNEIFTKTHELVKNDLKRDRGNQ